jgi:Zn-dependent protease
VDKLRIDASGLILVAFAFLILPLEWLISAVLAAGLHEMGHYLSAKLMRIPVFSVSVSASGCRMDTGPMSKMQEVICASAGPLVSLVLYPISRWMPILGLCALVQGLFNLLPVYPMDGGRILRAAAGERASEIVSVITSSVLAGTGIFLTFFQNIGPIPALVSLIILSKQNISCKSGKLTVK